MQNKIFLIGAYGIDTKDMLVLERIFKITEGRTRSYQVQDNTSGDSIDIAMVNVSNKDAIKQWGTENLDSNGKPLCPTLLVGKVRPKNDRFRFTPLPFFATRVLQSLDEITVEDLKYTPEIAIDDDVNNDDLIDNNTEATAVGMSQKRVVEMLEKGNAAKNTNKRAVLVVDDSLPVRQALEMKLTLMDYQVELATNGQQAMDMIEENFYDSIFLDVIMPGVDGYEVCKKVKRNKKTKHIPVIMLTSKSSPFDKVKGKLAGCDSYLTKPVEHEEFQKVVSGYLG
ncbi:MAG: response regulator [Gammaproteobacteria bacterium]|nr:response regulator [Gammaproteobacteria bacterium]